MKPSSESSAVHEATVPYQSGLELPVDAGFVSRPTQVTLAQMASHIRQLRRMFPAGIPSEEARWQRKHDAEFVL